MSVEREALEREIGEVAAKLSALRRKRRLIEIADGRNARAASPRILAIKKAYLANEISVGDIAQRFGTSRGFIQNLAKEFDWPRRSPPKARHSRSVHPQERAAMADGDA